VTDSRDPRVAGGPGAGDSGHHAPARPADTELARQQRRHAPGRRIRLDADPGAVQRDLVTLVLTIVELLRQLMERQALRRADDGTLTDEQIESIGSTLMALDGRMAELRDHFGLAPQDLNLDLGPLGPLLSYD
jgi:Gas vesicle protein K